MISLLPLGNKGVSLFAPMAFLVILLSPRERLRAAAQASPSARVAGEFRYVLSPDGLAVGSTGRCAPALLPRADTVVAVVADADVGWHRITLPKAPASRLRAALVGLLEEAVLDEADGLHYAVAPDAAGGEPTWIAAVHRGWLADTLAALEKANVSVERVVPSSWPEDPPQGHFSEISDEAGAPMQLTWADADGVATLRVQGGLARALLPGWAEKPARWTASPAVAAPAERWLSAPVMVLSDEQRALQAARSTWNLRQFDLAPKHRGTLALREAWRRMLSPAWRPVRVGLVTLVLLQVGGLNLWAWHQRQQVADKRDAMVAVLKSAHPQVRAVLDAPVQMQRETDQLRAAAGRAGDHDFETLLNAAALAWPPDRPAIEALRYEQGRLTIPVNGWPDPQIDAFRSQLQSAGWQVDFADSRFTITRAAATPTPGAPT